MLNDATKPGSPTRKECVKHSADVPCALSKIYLWRNAGKRLHNELSYNMSRITKKCSVCDCFGNLWNLFAEIC